MEVNRYDKEDVDDQKPDCRGGGPPCGIAAVESASRNSNMMQWSPITISSRRRSRHCRRRACLSRPATCCSRRAATGSAPPVRRSSPTTLLQSSRPLLANSKFVVYGYTDNLPVGPALQAQGIPDNLVLSTRRAAEVVNFLISQGIPAANISAKGFGDTKPVTSNDTPQGRAQNRRIEITVQGPG